MRFIIGKSRRPRKKICNHIDCAAFPVYLEFWQPSRRAQSLDLIWLAGPLGAAIETESLAIPLYPSVFQRFNFIASNAAAVSASFLLRPTLRNQLVDRAARRNTLQQFLKISLGIDIHRFFREPLEIGARLHE